MSQKYESRQKRPRTTRLYNLCQLRRTDRTQFVEIYDIKSDTLHVATCVPQGSIPGPLLFIIYINDFSETSQVFNVISHADDTTLLNSLSNFVNAQNTNSDLLIKLIKNFFKLRGAAVA